MSVVLKRIYKRRINDRIFEISNFFFAAHKWIHQSQRLIRRMFLADCRRESHDSL